MLRIICVENEHTAAVHVGGPPEIRYKTFEVQAPGLETWLSELKGDKSRCYNARTIVGVEVVK